MRENNKKNYYHYALIVLSIAGSILSAYMWYIHFHPEQLATCTISGCQQVLQSPWSMMLGIPIATLGFFYYAILTIIFFLRVYVSQKALENVATSLIITGTVFTVYLRYLEIFKIGEWCQYCWISVLCILGVIVLYIKQRKIR